MLKFQKFHGLGNDFIITQTSITQDQNLDWSSIAKDLCKRRFGVGADGLMTCTVKEGKPYMRIFNTDGSEAEMCGNGLRCFVHFLYREELFPGEKVEVHTGNGWLSAFILEEQDTTSRISIDLGIPAFHPEKIPVAFSGNEFLEQKVTVDNREFLVSAVKTGPPHAVVFVSDLDNFPADYWGPLLENHPVFPRKANINFTQVINKEQAKVVVWERGVGLTQACGTGAAAVAVIGQVLGKLDKKAKIELPGGTLEINWEGPDSTAKMIGKSQFVFAGEINI